MSTEHDLEYGPTPEGANYEHTDINPSIGYNFALWLVVAMAISAGIVYGTFWFFESQQVARDAAVQRYPLAVGQLREPPSPRLQTQSFKDVYLLKKGELDRLNSYGWAEESQGVVHIPIDRAMELTLQHGLPARADSDATQGLVVQDSSAGRTATRR